MCVEGLAYLTIEGAMRGAVNAYTSDAREAAATRAIGE